MTFTFGVLLQSAHKVQTVFYLGHCSLVMWVQGLCRLLLKNDIPPAQRAQECTVMQNQSKSCEVKATLHVCLEAGSARSRDLTELSHKCDQM